MAVEPDMVSHETRGRAVRSPTSQPAPKRSLLATLFIANGLVLALLVVVLAVTPITITAPLIRPAELGILLIAVLGVMALHLVLLRRVLGPIRQLNDLMRTIDPARPGRRLEGVPLRDTLVASLAGSFNEMLDRLEFERRESARVALAAQEHERLRVARELHDQIGQSLTAITLKAERAADTPAADPPAELRAIADDIRESLDDVRRIARELRPEALDDLGLTNALITLCSRMAAQAGLRIDRSFAPDVPALDPDVELVLYRVAQEGLTNVVRHSHARQAAVSLTVEGPEVVLRVRDDGVGLPDELPEGTAGLAGIRERALLVDGSLTIASEPGAGTRIELRVPTPDDAA